MNKHKVGELVLAKEYGAENSDKLVFGIIYATVKSKNGTSYKIDWCDGFDIGEIYTYEEIQIWKDNIKKYVI